MISKTPIAGMTKTDWLAERRKTIGGSEIGAILGLNTFSSAYDVWMEKTGRKPPFEGNLQTDMGTYLEDFVAQEFSRRSGLAVKRTNYIYRNTDYPVLHASPDRLIVGRDAGLECKTTSAFNTSKFHGEEFPSQYYAQAVQYMAVTEKEEWFIAVLVGNHAFHIYHLTRIPSATKPEWCEASLFVEQAEIDALNAAAEAFHDCVMKDTPPAIDGSDATLDALNAQYPGGGTAKVDLWGRDGLIEQWFALTEQEKQLKEQKQQIRNVLCADLGDNEEGKCGSHKVTWKTTNRTSFDSKACLKDHPEMAVYAKQTASRTFTIK